MNIGVGLITLSKNVVAGLGMVFFVSFCNVVHGV